jgi:hypothetical protein
MGAFHLSSRQRRDPLRNLRGALDARVIRRTFALLEADEGGLPREDATAPEDPPPPPGGRPIPLRRPKERSGRIPGAPSRFRLRGLIA